MKLRMTSRFGIFILLFTAPAVPALAMVNDYTIQIDGNMADWAPVLQDPENYVTDLSREQGDPDNPGSNDRDMRAFAATWDSSLVYFYFRRTLGGNNTLTLMVYVDRDHDNDLDGNDRVLSFTFHGSSPGGFQLNAYAPAGATDPITGDGVNEPGGVGPGLPATMSSAGASSGIEFEGSVTWASLGLAPGSPVRLHPSFHQGSIRDNGDPIDTRFAAIHLEKDRTASGASPSVLSFAHRARNAGDAGDILDINVRTEEPRTLSVYTDPDGDGDPSDGVLMGVDFNGDGDFSDPGDTRPTLDTNRNGLPDAGPLPPGGTFPFVVTMQVPADLAGTSNERVLVIARSDFNPNRFGRNYDLAVIGKLPIAPDGSKRSPGGVVVNFPHTVFNNQAFDDTANLTWSSLQGWTARLFSDPDGDGDPSDGVELGDTTGDGIPDTGEIPYGRSFDLVAQVAVPAGAPLDTRDTITITATSSRDHGVTDLAVDDLTVADEIALVPDHTSQALPGDHVFLAHALTNGRPQTDSFDLLFATSRGSNVWFWSDPNGDGIVGDGTRILEAGPLDASGGTAPFIAQIDLPMAIAVGAVETADIGARSQSDPAAMGAATDTVNILGCRTYANSICTYPSVLFYRCATVFAKAGGLSGGNYEFIWDDPNLADGPERISPTLSPDANGNIDDRLAMQYADQVGIWRVKVVRDGTPVPGYTFDFVVDDILSGSGVVDYLSADRSNYAQTGTDVTVVAQLFNQSSMFFFHETTLDHVIFRDADGNGVPSPGETFIQADGTSSSWSAGLATDRATNITLFPFQYYFDWFTVRSVSFASEGVWTAYCAWKTPCDTRIAEAAVAFDVGCGLGPRPDVGPDQGFCPGGSAVIGTTSRAGYTYSWYPTDGLGDPRASSTVAVPSATTTYTLTMKDVVTGCEGTDSIQVTVHAPPAPAILPDAPEVCPGGEAVLDAGAGYAAYLWSTGETSQTIAAAPEAATPYCVTVTDANGCQATACETVEVHSSPAPDVTPAMPAVCLGDAALLDAGAGYAAYQWSSGETSQTVSVAPSSTTEYCVTVTDSAGCQGSACRVVEVRDPPAPDVTPDRPEICLGGAAVLDAGPGFTAYRWSTGETSRTVTVAPAETIEYCVTVTDGNGCQATACQTINVHNPPAPDVQPDSPAVCEGGSVTLDAGPGYTAYRWSTGETSPIINVTPAQTTEYCVTVTDGNGCENASCETVKVHHLPAPRATPDKSEVCPGEPVELDAGPGFAEYAWSTGDTSAAITVTPASTSDYCVRVKDGNGCGATTCATVTVNARPTPSVTPNPPAVCLGGSAVLDAGPGYSAYRWSTGETSETLRVTPAQTTDFCVTVQDGKGCEAAACRTVAVHALPAPEVTTDRTAVCPGGQAMLDAGAGYAAYRWSTGETSRTISAAPAQTTEYCVTVTDGNGCEAAACRTVALNVPPSPAIAPEQPAVCPGGRAMLDAGPGYIDYRWSTGETSRIANVAPAQTTEYCVTVTDGFGCEATACRTVIVNFAPALKIAPEQPAVCPGSQVMLDAGPGHVEYWWSTGETSRIINVTPAQTTEYCVTVRGGNGCQATACRTVTVRTPPAPRITADHPEICSGGTVVLDAGPGYAAYAWSTGETSRTLTVAPDATVSYCVSVTGADGCVGEACTELTVLRPPAVRILPAAVTICLTESAELDAGPGYASYLWSTGATTRTISVSPTETTVYSCTVVNTQGCSARSAALVSVFVPEPPPDVGNTLRLYREETGMAALWGHAAGSVLFRVLRADQKTFTDAVTVDEIPAAGGPVSRVLPEPERDLAFYRIAGVNCAGGQGP